THECGALCGADLAHAIGNVALDLDRDEIDFAVWCSYKYLNGGPGAVGGLFVRSPSPKEAPHPALEGWWGHEETTRFLMGPDFRPEEGALGFAVSNVPVLSTTPLHAALPLFDRYPFAQLVEKRESLIDYTLSRLMDLELPGLSCITPLDPGAHGAQLSFMIGPNRPRGEPLIRALAACGVIADWREPHILRVAFHPLYNGFQDAERLVQGLPGSSVPANESRLARVRGVGQGGWIPARVSALQLQSQTLIHGLCRTDVPPARAAAPHHPRFHGSRPRHSRPLSCAPSGSRRLCRDLAADDGIHGRPHAGYGR
ncbi:kynureninase, partial [mine drainage metagenome]